MSLPPAVKVDKLEVQHDDYKYFKPVWETIADLREGATAIVKKAAVYLPKRPGEQEDVYQLRLAKISYTPVMSTAIREFTAKLAGAPIHIEGGDPEWLQQFRDSTDGKGRDENELLNVIFSTLLYFGRVFVAVDRPKLGLTPRSAFEDQSLANQPYTTVYEPLYVINWGEDWHITRQIITANQPLQEAKQLARWTVWDNEAITVYEAPVKLDPRNGGITDVQIGSEWVHVGSERALVPAVDIVNHNLGECPLVSLQLPNEMWTGNSVYLKQLQHFRIESSWTDTGVMAGTIQRVFTPMPAPPADDPRVVYEEPDYSQIKADNAHVLVGAGFQFVESSGQAIANLSLQLETIERQIKAIVSMSYASGNGALQQSGVSKQVDLVMLQDSMKAYGSKVAQMYQDILQLVARVANQPDNISVFGLDAYTSDSLSDMLSATTQIETVAERIPTTALKLWYSKLVNLMSGSKSSEVDRQIAEEIDQIYQDDQGLDPNNPDDIKALMTTFGLTNDEALEVLSGKKASKV